MVNKNKLVNFLNIVIIYLSKGVILVLPLFFLPWTREFFEFNKQYLLWLVIPLIVFLWLARMLAEGRIRLKKTPLDIPVIVFLFFLGLSSFLGLDRFSSFFGYDGRFSDAWLGILSFILFYFVITNFSSSEGNLKIFSLVKTLLFSYAIAVAVSVAAILGFWQRLFNTNNIISASSFNTIGGSLENLTIFISIILVLFIGLLSFSNNRFKRIESWLLNVSLVFSIIILMLVDFYQAWLLLALGCLLIIFFIIYGSKKRFFKITFKKIILPASLLALSLFFIFLLNLNLDFIILGRDLPREIRLSNAETFSVAVQSFKNYPLLGSGPGTFAYDFSLFRHPEFNYSPFWQFRFDKGSSHILEMLATTGILGILSYFLLISLFFYLNFALFRKHFNKINDLGLIISILIAFCLSFVVQLILPVNTVLMFLFWLLLAMAMSFWRDAEPLTFGEANINFKKNINLFRAVYLVIFLAAAGWLALFGFEVKYWIAEAVYAQGQNQESSMLKAISLNPHNHNYRVNLAKYYLAQAREGSFRPADEAGNQFIRINIDKSINTARQALQLNSNSVVCWETLGMIYRDVRLLTRGSEPWTVNFFTSAFELEPSNPVLANELGKAYLNNGDSSTAIKYFNRALELKGDFYEASLGLVKVYLKNNQEKEALIILDKLAEAIADPEIYYEQGRIYYNQGEIEKAMDRFRTVLEIFPNHSNALYSLAMALEAGGEEEEALKYLGKVLELNPDSIEIAEKIEELSH